MTERTRERDFIPPMELDPDQGVPVPEPDRTASGGGDADGATGPGVPARTEPVSTPVPAPRRWAVRLLVGAAVSLVAVAIGFDTADLIGRAFDIGLAPGAVVSLLATGAVVGGLGVIVGEMRSLARLRHIEALRAEAEDLQANGGHGGAEHYAGAVAKLYDGRGDLRGELADLRDHVTDAHDDAEVIRLVDRQVLRTLDRRAYQLVVRGARDTAIGTALSPAALLDAVIVLWRNLVLVREIAALYGARPGYAGGVRLLRRMLANIAVAGVAESGNDLVVEALGSTLAAALSARVGQGMINGLLTARVGVTAMHLCRPLAFDPTNRPSLKRIRRELLEVPKQVL
jgi:putative membrane protein